MKKIFVFIITAALLATLFILPAFAGDDLLVVSTTQNLSSTEVPTLTDGINDYPGSLVSDWDKNGYPDDVGGITVYTKGYDPQNPDEDAGKSFYTIYVLAGTSDARKAELKALANCENVDFVECKYSFNQIKAVYDEITKAMKTNGAIAYCGIQHTDTDPYVNVGILEENYDAVSADLLKMYGDKIKTEVGMSTIPSIGGESELGTITTGIGTENDGNKYFIVFAVSALILVSCGIAAMFVIRTKKARSLALSNGETVTGNTSVSIKETENKIKESAKAPSEHVYDDIMKKL